MTIYFAAGGLLGTAWVNTRPARRDAGRLRVALPVALANAGGLAALTASPAAAVVRRFLYSAGPLSGWTLLFLTFPAFIISPGLIQKSFGAASERALTKASR